MRFVLRNEKKITEAYSQPYFSRLVGSLKKHFNELNEKGQEIEQYPGEPYPYILVPDKEHTVNEFAFYVIKVTYDVYNLAFKETIG